MDKYANIVEDFRRLPRSADELYRHLYHDRMAHDAGTDEGSLAYAESLKGSRRLPV